MTSVSAAGPAEPLPECARLLLEDFTNSSPPASSLELYVRRTLCSILSSPDWPIRATSHLRRLCEVSCASPPTLSGAIVVSVLDDLFGASPLPDSASLALSVAEESLSSLLALKSSPLCLKSPLVLLLPFNKLLDRCSHIDHLISGRVVVLLSHLFRDSSTPQPPLASATSFPRAETREDAMEVVADHGDLVDQGDDFGKVVWETVEELQSQIPLRSGLKDSQGMVVKCRRILSAIAASAADKGGKGERSSELMRDATFVRFVMTFLVVCAKSVVPGGGAGGRGEDLAEFKKLGAESLAVLRLAGGDSAEYAKRLEAWLDSEQIGKRSAPYPKVVRDRHVVVRAAEEGQEQGEEGSLAEATKFAGTVDLKELTKLGGYAQERPLPDFEAVLSRSEPTEPVDDVSLFVARRVAAPKHPMTAMSKLLREGRTPDQIRAILSPTLPATATSSVPPVTATPAETGGARPQDLDQAAMESDEVKAQQKGDGEMGPEEGEVSSPPADHDADSKMSP